MMAHEDSSTTVFQGAFRESVAMQHCRDPRTVPVVYMVVTV